MPDPGELQGDLGNLLARVALGNHAAFKQLYDSTVRCLLAIIVRLLRDPAWAEEVMQEVYVAVWNSASSYSSVKAQPMTWLMTIARNKAMDALRSTASDREYIVRPRISDEEDENSGTPDVADERGGLLERLLQA